MSSPPEDRLSEAKSAFTVRGGDAPDIDAGIAAIRNVVKTLPARPGVYRMQDIRGEVLYVHGSAASRMLKTAKGMAVCLTVTLVDGLVLARSAFHHSMNYRSVVVLGTDQSLGPAVHRELELLVDGGIPPLDAIGIATRNGALFLGKERDLGTIEEGKLADLVILDANPAEDIDNVKKIHAVIKAGAVIDRSALQIPANGATEP